MNYQELTDSQWLALEPLFPTPLKRGRGKPHTAWRKVLNSILFILVTGSKWDVLPKGEGYASKSASNRWYKVWKKDGFLDQILAKLQALAVVGEGIQFPSTRVRLPKIQYAPLEIAIG